MSRPLWIVTMAVGDRHRGYAARLGKSVRRFHPEASFVVFEPDGLEFSPTNYKFAFARKLVGDNGIDGGCLAVLDADTALLSRVSELFSFEDDPENVLHAVHDYTGTRMNLREIHQRWQAGECGGSYLEPVYTSRFPDHGDYVHELAVNAGVLCFNLDNPLTGKVLEDLERLSSQVMAEMDRWPMEQGVLTHYVHHEHVPVKYFGWQYNSTLCEHLDPARRHDVRVMHYHDDKSYDAALVETALCRSPEAGQGAGARGPGTADRPVLHLLGLAHTRTDPCFSHCAFTMKVFNMARMMSSLGYRVLHYGTQGSTVDRFEGVEQVDVVGEDTWQADYGSHDRSRFQFRFDMQDRSWLDFVENGHRELGSRFSQGDLVLSSFGHPHAFALEVTGAVIEMGIGYHGVFAPFRVYESYAWMNETRAREGSGNPNAYHVVIPNSFDPELFPYDAASRREYLAYLGRMNVDKGLDIACHVAHELGLPLRAAGQRGFEGDDYVERLQSQYPGTLEHVGSVDVEQRARFLAGAIALLVPTQYPEPFGGVAVEAMMSGVPAVTSDWGAFPETVLHGITGYRCRTFRDWVEGVRAVVAGTIDRGAARRWALSNYSMDVVKHRYDRYFEDVRRVFTGRGWYETSPGHHPYDPDLGKPVLP